MSRSSKKSICDWLELEDEDPLFGLPFVVEDSQGTGLTATSLEALESKEQRGVEDPCFLAWFSSTFQTTRKGNKFVAAPKSPDATSACTVADAHQLVGRSDTDAHSCATTSVNSSVEGEESRREKKRCLLRDGCIHIESLDPTNRAERQPQSQQSSSRIRTQKDIEYQEYLTAQNFW